METNKTPSGHRKEQRKRVEERMARLAANGRTHPRREHLKPARMGRTHPRREHPRMMHMIEKKAEEIVE